MVLNWLSFEPSNVKIGLFVTEISGWPKLRPFVPKFGQGGGVFYSRRACPTQELETRKFV